MSFLNNFNKPRLLMYDASEYISSGFIGLPTGSYAGHTIKDIGSGSAHDWDIVHTTYNATKDALFKSVLEFIIATAAIYKESYLGGNWEYQGDTEQYVADYPTLAIGITEQGKIDFINSLNDISQKIINLEVSSKIFWNQFRSDKLTGIVDITIVVQEDYSCIFDNGPCIKYHPPPEIIRTINFDLYPTLTSEVYENYINSFKEYLFSLKKFMKIATNSDFEITELPFDFSVPFTPPYEP